MKILIVSNDFPTTSHPQTGIFILRRAQAVAALGHEVSVLRPLPSAPPLGKKWSSYNAVPEFDVVGDIAVHAVRVPMLPRMIAAEYTAALLRGTLEREIARLRPDIVHASYLVPNGHLVSRQNRVPSIVTAHGYDAYNMPFRRAGLFRASAQTIQNATRVTAVSGYIARCLQKISFRHVDVIWNGADERFFYPRDRTASRLELGLPAERSIAAYAGHVLRNKGLFELVEALQQVPPGERPLLVIAGDGADRAELERRAADLHVEACFLGAVPHETVAVAFGAADCVVLPSYFEGLPNVVCEAMLGERAVIATTAGGIPEILENGKTGLLVPPREVRPLAEALRRAFSGDGFRDSLAKSARAFATEHLTWRVSARKYESLYRQVLEQRDPRACSRSN